MVKLFGKPNHYVFEAKYNYRKHTINKKEVWVKLPHFRNMEKYLLARKLLSLNYVFHPFTTLESTTPELKNLEEWDKHVKAFSELPPFMKYCARTRRIVKKKTNVPEKAPSPPPPPNVQEEIDNPMEPICDLEDLAASSAKHLFEEELAKRTIEETEDWQCRNWRKQIVKDYKSFDVNEVISNARVAALNSKDIKTPPNLNAIFMESIMYAVNTHQWRLALKGVEGLLEELVTKNKSWLMWNGAFLAIANIYKDDISKIIEYATYAKDFMYCYPRRIGIELATWLTQKGYFTQGYQLLEEWHDLNGRIGTWDFVRDKDNPKRKNIDFIALLMEAVFQYSSWKRDDILFREGKYNGDDFSLKRSGETALELFEKLLSLSKETGCDITIIIQPLMELMVEFHGTFEARDKFKELVVDNYGNGIIEALYLEFLKTYFPFLNEEITNYEKRQEKYTLGKPPGSKKYDQSLRFQIAQKYKQKTVVPLRLKQKPAFSW